MKNALKAHGWERTFDWTDQDYGPERYADVALAELAGVRDADVLIVLLPGGYGTHVEIGAALALGKPVILHAPDRKTLETPYQLEGTAGTIGDDTLGVQPVLIGCMASRWTSTPSQKLTLNISVICAALSFGRRWRIWSLLQQGQTLS
jgi:hypothetical protein